MELENVSFDLNTGVYFAGKILPVYIPIVPVYSTGKYIVDFTDLENIVDNRSSHSVIDINLFHI
jgi:hypothetical protein